MPDTVVELSAITKQFGPVKALDDVSFELRRGEIHALLGVNGAGKSTLIKILSGVYVKDAGRIVIDGTEVELSSPRDAIAVGIAAVQQHPELVNNISGYENIFLGAESSGQGLFRAINRRKLKERARQLLKRFPIEIDLDRTVEDMPAVEREVVAVLRALTAEHIKVLILDEPTSTLTEREKKMLFQLMTALRAAGIAIIYITHRLEEVFEIADRFTVFRAGRNVATLSSHDARGRGISLADLMLGEKTGDLYPAHGSSVAGPVLLAARSLSRDDAFRNVSFEAREGEILGFFGLVGSGLDELSKVLFGYDRPTSGDIVLDQRPVTFSGPDAALRAGIFLVPGDRRGEGLTMDRNVPFNVTLANLKRASWRSGLMRRNAKETAKLAAKVDLQPPNLSKDAREFSGGNQQKIVIAKGLFSEANIYIFVEPTVGVDVGARAKIYALMRDLSRSACVIVMSSDCDEVQGVSDRVIGLYKGRVTYSAVNDAAHVRDRLLTAGIMGTEAA